MIDGELVIEILRKYVVKTLEKREREGNASIVNQLFPNEASALDIHIHAIKTLLRFSSYRFDPPMNVDVTLDINQNSKISLTKQLIQAYNHLFQQFSESIHNLSEIDIQNHLELICTLIMHTIVHAGQALRLQALYLRQKNSF